MKNLQYVFIGISLVFFTACGGMRKTAQTESSNSKTTSQVEKQDITEVEKSAEPTIKSYTVGDIVPKSQVCMYNNAYTAPKHYEVPIDDKMYYSCCLWCKGQIEGTPSHLTAIDPVSKQKVDKSKAIIAIVSENGKVIYFENTDNYKAYFSNK